MATSCGGRTWRPASRSPLPSSPAAARRLRDHPPRRGRLPRAPSRGPPPGRRRAPRGALPGGALRPPPGDRRGGVAGRRLPAHRAPHREAAADPAHGAADQRDAVVSGEPMLRRDPVRVSGQGRAGRSLRGLRGGGDACRRAARPGSRGPRARHGRRARERRGREARRARPRAASAGGPGVLADGVDVRLAVSRLRRRYCWRVDAVEGRPGYRLQGWPFRFTRSRSSAAAGRTPSADRDPVT